MAKIQQHKIENFSSTRHKSAVAGIPIVKNCNYEVVEGITITGDAPKKFIRVYDRSEKPKYFNLKSATIIQYTIKGRFMSR